MNGSKHPRAAKIARRGLMILGAVALVVTTGCGRKGAGGAPGGARRLGGLLGGGSPGGGLFQKMSGGLFGGGRPTTGAAGGLFSALGGARGGSSGGLPGVDSVGRGAGRGGIGSLLDSAASRHGIPPDILKAVAWQESNWNPGARSFDGGHGKGVMQIDDRYHNFAKTGAVFDPAQNIEYGANYLSSLYRQTGSWNQALQRYNGGSTYPGKVMALARRQPWGG